MWRIIFLTLFLFSSIAFAQTQEKPQATKIDEFDSYYECDVKIRLHNFQFELSKQPNSKASIIVYQSINALPSEYETSPIFRQVTRQVSYLRFDESNTKVIFGGLRNKMSAELWIVPSGAEEPQPSNTLPMPTLPTDKTFLYANSFLFGFESNFPLEYLSPSARKEWVKMWKESEDDNNKKGKEPTIEELTGYTEEQYEEMKYEWINKDFGEILKNQEGSTGTMIFYGDDKEYSIKNIRKVIEEGKRRISKETKLPLNKIKVIYGGFRFYPQIEFWVTPQNDSLPKPKPEKREVADSN